MAIEDGIVYDSEPEPLLFGTESESDEDDLNILRRTRPKTTLMGPELRFNNRRFGQEQKEGKEINDGINQSDASTKNSLKEPATPKDQSNHFPNASTEDSGPQTSGDDGISTFNFFGINALDGSSDSLAPSDSDMEMMSAHNVPLMSPQSDDESVIIRENDHCGISQRSVNPSSSTTEGEEAKDPLPQTITNETNLEPPRGGTSDNDEATRQSPDNNTTDLSHAEQASTSAEHLQWSGRRLRPRTQQQLNPYKYDFYQYDRAFRGSGMRPVRFKEYLDSSRTALAADDEDLLYEPAEEDDEDNQQAVEINRPPEPSQINTNSLATPTSARRRRRVILDEDDSSGSNSPRHSGRGQKTKRDVQKRKKPETFRPSFITANNVASITGSKNTNANITNDNENDNDNKHVGENDNDNVDENVDNEISIRQKGIAKRKFNNRQKSNTALHMGQVEDSIYPQTRATFDISDDDEDGDNDGGGSLRGMNADSPRDEATPNLRHDLSDFEVIESDWIDPMVSRSSKRLNVTKTNNRKSKKSISKPVRKLCVSVFKSTNDGQPKNTNPRVQSSGGGTQIHQARIEDFGSSTTYMPSTVMPHQRRTTTILDKFLTSDSANSSYHKSRKNNASRSMGSEPQLPPGTSRKRLSAQPHVSIRYAEMQKSRPTYMTSIVEAESGKFAVRRVKSRKPNHAGSLHEGFRYESSKELTPLPGENAHSIQQDLSDHEEDTQIEVGSVPKENSTASWATVLDIFQTFLYSGSLNFDNLPKNIIFDPSGLVGSGLLKSVLEDKIGFSGYCPVSHFGAELGTLNLEETELEVSAKLNHCEQVIHRWIDYSLNSPLEEIPFRVEKVYEICQFLLINMTVGKLALKEQTQIEFILLSLVQKAAGQWEGIPHDRRSLNTDFTKLTFTVCLFALLITYKRFKCNDGTDKKNASNLSKISSLTLVNLMKIGANGFRTEYQSLIRATTSQVTIRKNSYFETSYAVMKILNDHDGRFFPTLQEQLAFPSSLSADSLEEYNSIWGTVLAFSTVGLLGDIPNRRNAWGTVCSLGTVVLSTFPSTSDFSISQLRTFLIRCITLVDKLKWSSGVEAVQLLYKFYSNSDRKFRNVEVNGSVNFPQFLENDNLVNIVRPSDTIFHLFLKFTAITIMSLKQKACPADLKTLKSLSGRIRPLGFRRLNRDCELDVRELEALSNDYSLYLTLYRFCPNGCGRPTIPQLRDRLNLKESHILARKISLNAWYSVMKMTDENGKLHEVLNWMDDFIEISLKELEFCQNDSEIQTHFKEKNIRAYEDFIAVTLQLIPSILSDTHLLLRLPDWYKIIRPKLLSVLKKQLPLQLKEFILTIISAYISASEQLMILSGGMDEDSQEWQADINYRNQYGLHFANGSFDHLHEFLSNCISSQDISDQFLERLIQCWALSAKFLIKCGLKEWQDFFEGYSKYSWNVLVESTKKKKFEAFWMAEVCDYAFDVEIDLFVKSFFYHLVKFNPHGYEYILFNKLKAKVPMKNWLEDMADYHLSINQFRQKRETIIRRMLQKMDSAEERPYAKWFLEILKKEYRNFQRAKRHLSASVCDDFLLLVEDIISDARLYHGEEMGQDWFANNFPEVSDMSIYGYARRNTADEIFLVCVVSRLDSALKTGTLDTFEKAFILALTGEENDMNPDILALLKHYRRLVSEKILPSYLTMAREHVHGICMAVPLMRALVGVYHGVMNSYQTNSTELLELGRLLRCLKSLLEAEPTISQKAPRYYWELASSAFILIHKVVDWMDRYHESLALFQGILTDFYGLGLFLLRKIWRITPTPTPRHSAFPGVSVKAEVRRSVESFGWSNDELVDNQGNVVKIPVQDENSAMVTTKYFLLCYFKQYLCHSPSQWYKANDLVQISNDHNVPHIESWLLTVSTAENTSTHTTIDDVIF